MRKELLLICVAAILAEGCTDCSDCELKPESDQLSVTQQALVPRSIPEMASPWTEDVKILELKPGVNNALFGNSFGVYDLDGDGTQDIVSSKEINYLEETFNGMGGNNDVAFMYAYGQWNYFGVGYGTTTEMNHLGEAIAVGDFCPDNIKVPVVVASAPSVSRGIGAFAIMYKKNGAGQKMKTQMRLGKASDKPDRPGTNLIVADINNDKKMDIIYQAAPVKSFTESGSSNNLPRQVGVILDFCSNNTWSFTPDAVVSAGTNKEQFGYAMYVEDLDGNGQNELIVVDPNYNKPSGASAPGAIHFYKYSNGALVESRPMIVGEMFNNNGVSISSVAFSDIDGDGDLDLIAGGPRYYGGPYPNPEEPDKPIYRAREGYVRTYTNNGPGQAFDTGTPLWMYSSGRKGADFGAFVTVDDLNSDGVDDLIVGAPGDYGYVHVFMGTSDGSIFSIIKDEETNKDKPYWSYSPYLNDGFGSKIIVADADKGQGWKDLFVSAPNYGPDDSNPDQGRIYVLSNKTAPCYTANRCLINGKCYEPNEVAEDNKCISCNPKSNNFDFSEVSCTGEGSECLSAPTCSPSLGCQGAAAPDGTPCRVNESMCIETDEINSFLGMACQAGACTKNVIIECGEYKCDRVNRGCVTVCSSNQDCVNGYVCESGSCVAENHPPVAVLPFGEYTLEPGKSKIIDGTGSYDPDPGYALTYSWSGDGAQYLNKTNIANPTFTVPATAADGTTYTLVMEVKDEKGLTDEAMTTIKVSVVAPPNNPPVATIQPSEYEAEPGKTVIINGSGTDPDGDTLTYAWSGNGAQYLTNASIAAPTFRVPTTATDGTIYNLSLTVSDPGGLTHSANATVKVKVVAQNHAPVAAIQPSEYEAEPGKTVIINGSGTDPDGDTLTYAWSGNGAQYLTNANIAAPTFNVPTAATDGTIYNLSLTVSDPGGLTHSANATVKVKVVAQNHAPVASIKQSEYEVEPGKNVIIDGSGSSDPDPNDRITYSWTGAGAVYLSNTKVASPTFRAPANATDGTTYELILTVKDRAGLSDSTKTTVRIKTAQSENHPPVAVLPEAYTYYTGNELILDASGSYDPDGDKNLSYDWSATEGVILTPTNDPAKVSFSAETAKHRQKLTVSLVVTDSKGASSSPVSTKVTYFVSTTTNVSIESPADGSDVSSPVLVEGNADTYGVSLRSNTTGETLCEATPQDNLWSCKLNLDIGSYSVTAYGVNELGGDVDKSKGVTFNVTEIVNPTDLDIRITSPVNGEIVSLTPIVSGVVDHATTDGKVEVWVNKNDTASASQVLCTVNISPEEDGTHWECPILAPLEDNSEYILIAAVTDSDGNYAKSETVSVMTKDESSGESPVIKIESPMDGDVISLTPLISGIIGNATANGTVDVWAMTDGSVSKICSTEYTVVEDGNASWVCSVVDPLENGMAYSLAASMLDENGVGAVSSAVNVMTNVDIENLPVIRIDSPQTGDVVPLRPSFSGTISNVTTDGVIDLWVLEDSVVTKVCSSEYVLNGETGANWSCVAGFDLNPETDYYAYARHDESDAVSNIIQIRTQNAELSSIKITSPANGAKLVDTYPVLFAGTVENAVDNSTVDVYITTDYSAQGEYINVCRAIVKLVPDTTATENGNPIGYWSCEVNLEAGSYTAYADDTSDEALILSPGVSFTIDHNYKPIPEYWQNHDARGGSCSVSTLPASNSGWMLLLAGAAGLLVLRRRRED